MITSSSGVLRLRIDHVLVGIALILSACGNSQTSDVTSSSSTVSYTVSGKQILDDKGKVFVPYGLQIIGSSMADNSWKTNDSSRITLELMRQARDVWHSNTTRLQVSTVNLFAGIAYPKYNAEYLNRIDEIVGWASQLDMNIVLSLQYETAGSVHYTMPVQDSLNFWKIVAPQYANNARVFFDLFNEPNKADQLTGQSGDNDIAWNFWQNGGVGTDGVTYVGMQTLVDEIRNSGATNLIFAEGLAAGEDIVRLPNHTLSGSNIVYTVHPYLNATQHHTSAQWDLWFGNSTNTLNAPVVADEWGQWSASPGCITDAPTVVPEFLTYLQAHDIGLIGYAYWPNTSVVGWDITSPTRYASSTTQCGASAPVEGAGELLRQHFEDRVP